MATLRPAPHKRCCAATNIKHTKQTVVLLRRGRLRPIRCSRLPLHLLPPAASVPSWPFSPCLCVNLRDKQSMASKMRTTEWHPARSRHQERQQQRARTHAHPRTHARTQMECELPNGTPSCRSLSCSSFSFIAPAVLIRMPVQTCECTHVHTHAYAHVPHAHLCPPHSERRH